MAFWGGQITVPLPLTSGWLECEDGKFRYKIELSVLLTASSKGRIKSQLDITVKIAVLKPMIDGDEIEKIVATDVLEFLPPMAAFRLLDDTLERQWNYFGQFLDEDIKAYCLRTLKEKVLVVRHNGSEV